MNKIPRQLVGRLAALFTALGALASTIGEFVDHGTLQAEQLATPLLSVAAAVLLWFLPWERLGSAGTLGFMWLSLAAIFFGDLYQTEQSHPEEIPVFLLTLFAWNGLAHRRWSSLKFLPAALAVLIGPGLIRGDQDITPFSVGLTLPMCLFVGELVAWVAGQLVTAQEERKLADLKADFLTAASHELRTPLTSLLGFSRLLEKRNDQLSHDEVSEFSGRIVESAVKLEGIVSRLVDVDQAEDQEAPDLKRIGLLAAHYTGDGASEVQEETLTQSKDAGRDS
jgi:signal transduction histidine kinase